MNTATTAAVQPFSLHDVLRAVANSLEIPVMIIIIIVIVGTVLLLGWVIAEAFTEHRHLKIKLPQLLDEMRSGAAPLQAVISGSGLLKSQKEALLELTRHPEFDDAMREALAVRLLEQEQARYDRIVKLSETVQRLGPMLGLLGTLIPLGPGIVALGQGDTFTLSTSLLTAFDSTISGLASAAIATVITTVRRAWYKNYMSILEVLANCVLEVMKEEEPEERAEKGGDEAV